MPTEGVGKPPADRSLPPGFRLRMGRRVQRWADGSVLVGGSPWRVSRIAPPVQDLVARLADAGPHGLVLSRRDDLRVARVLLDRDFAEQVTAAPLRPLTVEAIVPAFGQPGNITELLASMPDISVLVVDDASPHPESVAAAVAAQGARLVRHEVNCGPGSARNSGQAASTADVLAFIDSDCIATPGWARSLMHHFDDPGVAAVAPRVIPTVDAGSVLERYERTRSALDMGSTPQLVRPGARLGFVPSAALLVRRDALGSGFDPDLRLGEDVDLIWRLCGAGWLVRYDPSVIIRHRTRTRPIAWLTRRHEYGTSAPTLERRHPGYLAPARPSAWNTAALAAAASGRPGTAAVVAATAAALLAYRLRTLPRSPELAARTVAMGLVADGAAIGQLLRREWWPVGALSLATAPKSRLARFAAALMLAPLAWEWATQRPPLDPVRYAGMRLIDDAAYGTGVLSSSWRHAERRTLLPRLTRRS